MMAHSNFALIIRHLETWNIYTATLYHIKEYKFYFTTAGKVEVTEVADDAALSKLVSMCAQCEEKALYESFGKKKFKTEANFRTKADETMQRQIKQATDKRLSVIIQTASKQGIHLYLRGKVNSELLKNEELSLATSLAIPRMIFRRGDEGINYTLHLKLNEEEVIAPCEHHPLVLSEIPGIILLNHQIYFLPDGSSAKLLSPFLNKPSIFIPSKNENEYFRLFIYKNTYKTEILAEGFDIVEKQCKQKCRILIEKNIHAEAMFCVQFVYDDIVFDTDDPRKLFVHLEKNEESFSFIKFNRKGSWEQQMTKILKEDLGMPEKGSLPCLIEWLKMHTKDLEEAGIEFLQPSTNKYYIGDAEIRQSTRWNNDWLQIHIEIHLDDGKVIPFLKLKDAILNGEHEYMLDDGSIFLIPDEWFARYSGVMIFGRAEEKIISIHRSQLPITAAAISEETKNQIPEDLSVPQGLKAELRHYQQIGFEWLYRHFITQTGCCLSDDMGLGKTVQTIALLLKYKETCRHADNPVNIPYQTSLVVAPASVVHNWRNELQRFAPQLFTFEYTGNTEDRRKNRQALMRWDVVLMSYQTLRNDIDHLSKLSFGIVVFDESQCFKNRNSQLYQSISDLQAYHRIALSGTPIENSLSDLWSLMSVLNPTLLGDHKAFQRNYINSESQTIQDRNSAILRTLIAPYFLKRSKEEVLPDLPERLDELVLCEMSAEQQRIYDEELSRARNWLMSQQTATDGVTFQNRPIPSDLVLNTITRLRQIACHPRLIEKKDSDSGKFNEIFSRLETLYETDHKVLIFSEYTQFLDLVAEEMKRRKWTYQMLTGETPNREAVINRFSNTSSCRFFLISLKAGGVGLNLTSADYVFMLDPWWNLAAEEQAISRAHRIGQKRSVFVYRFISRFTLEEEILNVQDRKQSMIQAVLPFLHKKR